VNHEEIREQLAAAQAGAGAAETRLYAAEALAHVTAQPGLWYAPDSPDQTRYVVGCNGAVIGYLWPAHPGQVLTGWTAAQSERDDRLGPFPTARAAAAALVKVA
jgi:hypothetical protein